MRIAALQLDIAWCAPALNVEKIERRLAELMKQAATGGDEPIALLVLPEMFTTGFVMTPQGVADGQQQTLTWMQQIAADYQVALAGSVAVEQEGAFFNRFYFVQPDGTVDHYDKRHLFTYGGEQKAYQSGENRVIVSYRGYRFLLQICYDLRFPLFSRNTAKDPYDVILYVANWPTSRIAVWNTLLVARALENQCYVVGVNRVGEDTAALYNGSSAIINAYGKSLTVAPTEQEELLTATLDSAALQRFRAKFPVLEDADSFVLKEE